MFVLHAPFPRFTSQILVSKVQASKADSLPVPGEVPWRGALGSYLVFYLSLGELGPLAEPLVLMRLDEKVCQGLVLSLAHLRPSAGGSGATSILAPSRLLPARSHTPWCPGEGRCGAPSGKLSGGD